MSNSDDYEQYSQWEERLSLNGKPKPKTFEEALKAPRYNGGAVPEEREPEPTTYTDENGKRFRFIFGQRVYLEE